MRGETTTDKAIPFGVDRHTLMETKLGSWMGHMNAISRIVEEDLESALILEDDMDWEIRLRSQLEGLAEGTRFVLANKGRPSPPYGDGWIFVHGPMRRAASWVSR